MEPVHPAKPPEPISLLEIKPLKFDKVTKIKQGDNENKQVLASSSHGDVRQEILDFGKNPEGGNLRGSKKSSGDQKPEASTSTDDTKLGKDTKPIKAAKATDIKLDVKPKVDLKSEVPKKY